MTQLARDRTGTFTVLDLLVTVGISPCSWMHTTYGLQLHFKLPTDGKGNGGEFVVLKKPWAECTTVEFDTMVTQMRAKLEDGGLLGCPTCGKLTWNGAVFPNQYRNANCEECFLVALNAEFKAGQDKDNKRIARMDAKRKGEGYTHRVDAWIHQAQGDDRLIGWYSKGEPEKPAIRALLVSRGSKVVDDYKVIAL